jgi:hypothetical protein
MGPTPENGARLRDAIRRFGATGREMEESADGAVLRA